MKIKCGFCNKIVEANSDNLNIVDVQYMTIPQSLGYQLFVQYQYHCPKCWTRGRILRQFDKDDLNLLLLQVPFIEKLHRIENSHNANQISYEDDVTIEALV